MSGTNAQFNGHKNMWVYLSKVCYIFINLFTKHFLIVLSYYPTMCDIQRRAERFVHTIEG